jgi:hypothetical protein
VKEGFHGLGWVLWVGSIMAWGDCDRNGFKLHLYNNSSFVLDGWRGVT